MDEGPTTPEREKKEGLHLAMGMLGRESGIGMSGGADGFGLGGGLGEEEVVPGAWRW